MNIRLVNTRVTFAALLLMSAGAFAQTAIPKGQLRLPEFAALADKASESVNVTLDQRLLGIAGRFLNPQDPEQAKARKLVTGLTGVYVRSFKFDDDFAYPKTEVEAVRRQLEGASWSRIVEARSKKENTDVNLFVYIYGEQAKGLAIIALEPREFTIVNIVGAIDLADLHELEGNFGVPELEIETGKKPEKAAKPKN
jgi:Domain of unknown function (DUF4252)